MNKNLSLARVVGHLMGDGYVNRRYIRYNNKNEFLLKNFQTHFSNIFSDIHFIKGRTSSGTLFVQVQNKKIIGVLFGLCEDFRSHNLKFPNFIKTLGMKREFISSIFDDEGCVGLRIFKKTGEIKRNLEIASKSKKFLGSIKVILEKDFNIKCNKIISFTRNLNGKKFITWKLSITGKENFIKFKDKINFNSPEKIKRLDYMINSYIRK